MPTPAIGSSLFDIITIGMYSDPLMVIREYIQNAADAIDMAVENGILGKEDGRIDVTVDGANRDIIITDNGIGISPEDARRIMSGIGLSTKKNGKSRGFRGIGRLAGIGYCQKIIFISRAPKSGVVIEVIWDGSEARRLLREQGEALSTEQLIRCIVDYKERKPNKTETGHFFKVIMKQVEQFHEDHLVTPKQLARYISHNAPLPFDTEIFSFAEKINLFLSDFHGYNTYRVFLNGTQLFKPYKDDIVYRGGVVDKIRDVSTASMYHQENQEIGRYWNAVTGCVASLPPLELMRGITLRQGNILVGDEYYLADKYSERRFATWHIGEIHVADSLKTNARRDSFEHNKEFESLLEQASILCVELSKQCRLSSKIRSTMLDEKREVDEKLLFFVNEEHRSARHKTVDTETPFLENILDKRTLRKTSQENIIIELAGAIARNYHSNRTCDSLLRAVFKQFIKKKYLNEDA